MTNENDLKRGRTALVDGTPISSLVDRDKREVSTRLFSDPEIYQLELERIFAKNWIIVGHESEISEVGDFVTRRLGDDPVIVARCRDGGIDCMLNVCSHRGALVCREEAGNSSVFRCIYHGWIFNLDGSFRGAPFKEEMYPDGMDASRLGLRKARVGVYGGIIFANWDESAPSLEDYLGDYKYYLNLIFNKVPNGMEVLGPPQRFVINANWKTASEQFGGDAYHAGQLHRSLGALTGGSPTNPRDWQLHAPKVSTENGHNIICFDLGDMYRAISGGKELSPIEKLHILPPSGVPPEMLPEMLQLLGEKELEFLATTPPGNGGIFPNAGVWNMHNPMYNGVPAPFLSFRTYLPLGPDKFEFCMWVLVAKGASEEYRDLMRRSTSFMQGASGFIEGDDAEVWPGQTSASRGYIGRQGTLKYWTLTGEHKPEGWPGEGNVHAGFSRDDPQWNWWQRYFDRLEEKV
jgi:phenylpropionate dioxygenase-like ring-hydroxylating dioxygenase large terminal subunit